MTGFSIDRIRSLVHLNRGAPGTAAEPAAIAPLAQEATPAAEDPEALPASLFVQSFHSGQLAPSDTHPDRLTVTLEHGLGQTIVFSDRPARTVAASPTAQFLEGLGFPPDNPPNAALILETSPGEQEITVVELFDPVYDEATATLIYDIAPLATWHDSTDFGLTPSTLELSELPAAFGPAHLFIDDCVQGDVLCLDHKGVEVGRFYLGVPGMVAWVYSTSLSACIPITQLEATSTTQIVVSYVNRCNAVFDACFNNCDVLGPAPYFNYYR